MTKEYFISKWLPKGDSDYKQLMLNDLNRVIGEENLQDLTQRFLQPEKEVLADELQNIKSGAFSNKTKFPHAEFLLDKYFMFTKLGEHLLIPTV